MGLIIKETLNMCFHLTLKVSLTYIFMIRELTIKEVKCMPPNLTGAAHHIAGACTVSWAQFFGRPLCTTRLQANYYTVHTLLELGL